MSDINILDDSINPDHFDIPGVGASRSGSAGSDSGSQIPVGLVAGALAAVTVVVL